MVEPEEWGPKDIFLVNYFVHTLCGLYKAQENEPAERYVVRYERKICFNTGLVTTNMEPIFALFWTELQFSS